MSEVAGKSGAPKRGRLAERRKAVGLTQEQLAGQLGVERTTVVRWERGETQPLPWLRPKLAKALGVSADRIEELLAAGGVPAGQQAQAAAVTDLTERSAELETLAGTREGTRWPRPLRSRAARAGLAMAALAAAAIAVLITGALSGPAHPASTASPTSTAHPASKAATGQWQCGPFMRATLWEGNGIGQRLQACIAAEHGQLDLKGVLTGSVNAWKEQIILVLKHPRQPTYEKLTSPVCTTSTCTYQVAVNPGPGSWWVIPQWKRSDGGYQSTGQPSPPVTLKPSDQSG
jgi:transcriptional regulator with XRE-family HTH domain